MNKTLLMLARQLSTVPFWDGVENLDEEGNSVGTSIAGYEGPLYSPDPADHVSLAGEKLPGVATVKGSASHKVDVQKANGRDGAALVERGYQPGRFDIDVLLWTPEQWDTWQQILPKFWRKPGKLDYSEKKKGSSSASAESADVAEKAAVSISNWRTDMLGIGKCIVESVTLPDDGPVVGTKTITLKCVEYVEAVKAKQKATKVNKGNREATMDPRLNGPTVNKPAKPSEREGSPAAPLTPTKGTR